VLSKMLLKSSVFSWLQIQVFFVLFSLSMIDFFRSEY